MRGTEKMHLQNIFLDDPAIASYSDAFLPDLPSNAFNAPVALAMLMVVMIGKALAEAETLEANDPVLPNNRDFDPDVLTSDGEEEAGAAGEARGRSRSHRSLRAFAPDTRLSLAPPPTPAWRRPGERPPERG